MQRAEDLVLTTDRLVLRALPPSDAPRVRAYYEKNEPRFGPWSPARPKEFFENDYWRLRLATNLDDIENSEHFRLHVLERSAPEGPVIGNVSLTHVESHARFSGCLGYGIDTDYERTGRMREAVAEVIEFGFRALNLHRIEAEYDPLNAASAQLLKRLGFSIEGYARDFLLIDDKWHDHVRAALINQAWPAQKPNLREPFAR